MVEREDEQGAGLLRRWSRRKQELATPGKEAAELEDVEPLPAASLEATTESAETESVEEEPLLTDDDMPDIESIGKDSDVSCFFNRGVSEQLRQRALRHLLRLPAFNITDGLNDYDEDYTTFEPLGDIVTSDMRFQAKRKEKLAAQQREEEEALAQQQAEELEAAESSTDETDPVENAESPDDIETAGEHDEMDESAADDSPPQPVNAPVSAQLENNGIKSEALTPDNTKPGDLV